ncbi:uncharacterized protein N7482_003797 [Penicillium canariense]|uniref:Centrosomin N-terminal motif 1 domain-containing protein n=1 Tax=Penicillium canariense TaxID=189055 RepID=A0A9W9LPY2_9EURO|nr:uncharacterized protein N7482_003797 [Penicillium canariense]KAJ5168203.1 hypothetical protein N7482_003797 [Penicillium canariense]
MDAGMKDRKTQRRSSAAPAAPSGQSKHSHEPLYHTDTAPSARSVSSKRRPSQDPDCSSDRPQHPSLSRVKGRSNMYTPPRLTSEVSWLRDESPVHVGTRTPPRQCKTPDNGTPTLVNPASTLLQDLLKEQRAHRISRGALPEDWDDSGPRTPEGSRLQDDTASEKARKVNDAFAAGQRQPKEMGMREMDQYVSKMNKLNFDLKLEIHHRAEQMQQLREKVQRMEEMEKELRRMHKLEEEVVELRVTEKHNQRLRESNELLRQELDKRNVAVTEAVQLICQLEAKIDELELGGRTSQMSVSRPVLDEPNATTPKRQTAIEIPERTSSKRNLATMSSHTLQPQSSELRQLSKAPSFLRADNRSTATLRSLYAPENNTSHSALSALTKSQSFNTIDDVPESPRLSVLSECSELNPLDTPTRWNEFDKLDIPVRRTPSTTGSLHSYMSPIEHEESKEDQIDRWMQSRPDMSETIVRRRQTRAMSDASKTVSSPFGSGLYQDKPRGRPRLDASLFGGARLPPTPDTMSTARAPVNNGSDGSIAAQKSPKPDRDQWLAGRPLERHRSADELTVRHSFNSSFNGSFNGSESMQANWSDTPRLGTTNDDSPTFFPFNTVANKASALLGPGSPNNPSVQSFGDVFHQNSNEAVPRTVKQHKTPTKARPMVVAPELERFDEWESPSPPLTPNDWVAAAKRGPRSRKERKPPRTIGKAAFHDDHSIASIPTEPDGPEIPTLDMTTLDILEQSMVEIPIADGTQPQPVPAPEARRRISFLPTFLRSNNTKRLQSSPVINDFAADDDDEEEGAPSPVIPKSRTPGKPRRPLSQTITSSADVYSSSLPTANDLDAPLDHKPLHQSLMEARENHAPPNFSATISGRPSTSHSMENHKRRSSLGIFGWMKGVSGKRSEPASPTLAEKTVNKENRAPSRLVQDGFPRAETPDSFDAPIVRPRSEMTMHSDDQARKPRYMGRRSRRG